MTRTTARSLQWGRVTAFCAPLVPPRALRISALLSDASTAGIVVAGIVKRLMKITVVGRGNVGGGLAHRWEQAGHEVRTLGSDGADASDADVIVVARRGRSGMHSAK